MILGVSTKFCPFSLSSAGSAVPATPVISTSSPATPLLSTSSPTTSETLQPTNLPISNLVIPSSLSPTTAPVPSNTETSQPVSAKKPSSSPSLNSGGVVSKSEGQGATSGSGSGNTGGFVSGSGQLGAFSIFGIAAAAAACLLCCFIVASRRRVRSGPKELREVAFEDEGSIIAEGEPDLKFLAGASVDAMADTGDKSSSSSSLKRVRSQVTVRLRQSPSFFCCT